MLWRDSVQGRDWRAVFLSDDGKAWKLELGAADDQEPRRPTCLWLHDRLQWSAFKKPGRWPPGVVKALRANLRQRYPNPPRLLDQGQRTVLEAIAGYLEHNGDISGGRLRQQLGQDGSALVERAAVVLVPRYLVLEPDQHGRDHYELTLAGLLQTSVGGRATKMLEDLLAFFRERFRADPDFRDYSWQELSARPAFQGVPLPLVTALITMADWQNGANGSGGDYRWGTPIDVEPLQVCADWSAYLAYLRSGRGGRPWPSAPALLLGEEDMRLAGTSSPPANAAGEGEVAMERSEPHPNLDSEVDAAVQRAGWLAGTLLGKGGGGAVYRCYSAQPAGMVLTCLQHAADGRAGLDAFAQRNWRSWVETFVQHFAGVEPAAGALKIPHGSDDVKDIERLRREISAMETCRHPHLVRILARDAEDPPRWFVMEYHPFGTIEAHQSKFHGNPVDVLRALRPLTEGLALLHEQGLVHRDIKPKNVFLATDGRWILGDMGIVFDHDADRLTVDTRTMHSKHWRPDWIDKKHVSESDYGSTVDVFGLAKVAYFMISGLYFAASNIDEPENDIRQLFPNRPHVSAAYDLLRSCIVTKSKDCAAQTAADFGRMIDGLLDVVDGKDQPSLVYEYVSTHSTCHVTVGPGGAASTAFHLRDVPVLVSGRHSRFVARAGIVARPNHRGDAQVHFALDGRSSSEGSAHAESTEKVGWSGVMALQLEKPLEPGWHRLSVVTAGDQTAVCLCAFTLYATSPYVALQGLPPPSA
ncbi:MAG: protein kinase [Deltaproteobacteria bacterium]|nr:protein kinase [Deltaproteobacteria bacterium]